MQPATPAPKPGSSAGRRVIYTLERERSYHFVTLVLAVLAVLVGWLASLLSPEEMTRSFGSVGVGRLVQGIFWVIALTPLATWLWWMRRYIRRLTWLAEAQEVELERCGYFGQRVLRVPPAKFVEASAHEGRSDFPAAPTVHAPYVRIRITGLPSMILDQQGTIHDAAALEAILAGKNPG